MLNIEACLFIKDDEVLEKFKQIWNLIKNKLKIKFHSESLSDKNT